MIKPTTAQDSILELLHSKYEMILPIEEQWGIRFKQGDMRARIEYFHDAVRAFTQSAHAAGDHPRLKVEQIAYDVSELRQIQEKPLGRIYGAVEQSASDALLVLDGKPTPTAKKTPPASVRAELKQHYKNYMVFFSALLCDAADRDYFARTEEMDETIADIGLIETMIKQMMAGKLSQKDAQTSLEAIAHDGLREKLQALLAQKKMGKMEMAEALQSAKKVEEKLEKDRKTLDERHLQMATGKLAVLQDSKDVVQQLMQSGLNLAGKFLAQASAQSTGRGQGMGV